MQQAFLPIAVPDKYWFISKNSLKERNTIDFLGKTDEKFKIPKPVLVVSNNDFKTVISFVTIFEWIPDPENSLLASNKKALNQLKSIQDRSKNRYFISSVKNYIELAVRRILTTLTSIEMETL